MDLNQGALRYLLGGRAAGAAAAGGAPARDRAAGLGQAQAALRGAF